LAVRRKLAGWQGTAGCADEAGGGAIVVVEQAAGPDRVEPARRQPGDAVNRVVRQAHSMVRSTRRQLRCSRVGGSHPLPAHPVHRRQRVLSTRRGLSQRSDQQAVERWQVAARSVIICLAVTVATALVYVALAELAHWETHQRLFWSGLLLIVVAGAICENAISLEAAPTARRTADDASPTPGRT